MKHKIFRFITMDEFGRNLHYRSIIAKYFFTADEKMKTIYGIGKYKFCEKDKMKKYTEQEVEKFLREQRKICADRAVIDYAEPDKLMMLKHAPEPASFISSKQDVIKSVCVSCEEKETHEVCIAVLADSLPSTCIDGFSDDKFCDRTNGCKWCRGKR